MSWAQLVQWQMQGYSLANCPGGHNSFVLMIDDLEMLELLAPSLSEARRFVNRALSYLDECNYHGKKGSLELQSLIAYGRSPLETLSQYSQLNSPAYPSTGDMDRQEIALDLMANRPLDEDQCPSLTEYLRYKADMCICVDHLQTGYSANVHGILSIIEHKRKYNSNSNSNSNSNRAIDSGKRAIIGGGVCGGRTSVMHFKALDSGVSCSLVSNS